MTCGLNDAHDLPPDGAFVGPLGRNPLAEGTFAGPIETRREIADDDDRLGTAAIAGIEQPAIDEPHAHGLEVARRHVRTVAMRSTHPWRWVGKAFDREPALIV